MSDLDSIVVALRRRRVAAGLTQRELADLVGVWQSSVSEWESGASVPSVRSLIHWAGALGCTVTLKKVDPS